MNTITTYPNIGEKRSEKKANCFILLKKNSIVTVAAFISVELMLYTFAITDSIKNKSYASWNSLSTTKELQIDN